MFPFGCRSSLPPRLPRRLPVPRRDHRLLRLPARRRQRAASRRSPDAPGRPPRARAGQPRCPGRRSRTAPVRPGLGAAGTTTRSRKGAVRIRPPHGLLALRRPARLVSLRCRLAARRDLRLPSPPGLARISGPSPPPLAVRHREAAGDHPGTGKALPACPPPRTPGRHHRDRRGIPYHRALGPARLLPRPTRSPDPGTARKGPHNRQAAVIR